MSNLLKEAIVDAKALKDAALKNAEATIIQKYSQEVKQTIDHLVLSTKSSKTSHTN